MAPPERSHPWTRIVRSHWEVASAAGILLLVLAVIDVAAIHEPRLLLSLCPLSFMLTAAVSRLTPPRVVAWIAAFIVLALATGEMRYSGLGYAAVAVAFLQLLRRLRQGSE